MAPKIITCLILTVVSLESVFGYTDGDCFHERTQKAGLCIDITQCDSAFKNVRNHNSKYYPQICRFENISPYVCCPIETEERIGIKANRSEEKCQEYSKSLLNVVLDSKNRQIIDGEDALEGEFPHMAAIGYGDLPNTQWFCAGSLISENFVLTVAHCRSHSQFGVAKYIQLGDITLSKQSSSRRTHEISRFINHPGYKPPQLYDDIALIELKSPVQFSPHIKPACLQTSPDITTFQNHKTIVSGWGITEPDGDQVSEILQKVQLNYFDNCSNFYKNTNRKLPTGVNNDMHICFGSKLDRKDACKGDSGGPIQIFDFGLYLHRIVGLVSAGKSCGLTGSPGLYTKVSNYISWIEDIVWP